MSWDKFDAERAAARKGKKKPYIVVAHHSDGIKVTEHSSKKEAHTLGMSLRNQGITAYAHSKEDAEKYHLDPRKWRKR